MSTTPQMRGFYMSQTVGIGIVNPGTKCVWHLTPEQSEAIALAAEKAGMTVDAYIDHVLLEMSRGN